MGRPFRREAPWPRLYGYAIIKSRLSSQQMMEYVICRRWSALISVFMMFGFSARTSTEGIQATRSEPKHENDSPARYPSTYNPTVRVDNGQQCCMLQCPIDGLDVERMVVVALRLLTSFDASIEVEITWSSVNGVNK